MATRAHTTTFLSIPAPRPAAGAVAAAVADDAHDADAGGDAALDRADPGAAQDPVSLMATVFWPWRRRGE